MLNNDFFKVIQVDNDGACLKAELELNPDHEIFTGHFPGTPVVPGVCMMQMVKEIVEMNVGKVLMLSKADSMKFLSVIDPRVNRLVNVDLSFNLVDELIAVTASITSDERVCFKFRGVFITTQDAHL